MKKQKFVTGVATACEIFFTVMKVLSALGAVLVLLSSLFLLFLPADFFSIKTDTDVSIHFSMESLVGEAWGEVSKDAEAMLPEGAGLTEDGFVLEEGVTETLSGRNMSLSLIPIFVQLLTSFYFYHFLQKVAKSVHFSAFTPFTLEGAEGLKNAGLVMFAMELAPALTETLITVFTRGKALTSNFEIGFTNMLWAFVLIALSYLFEYGFSISPKPTYPPQNENR